MWPKGGCFKNAPCINHSVQCPNHPTGAFDFTAWKYEFMKAKDAYERLHEDLLYTDEKQIFDDAVDTFEKLNNLFCEIGE